LLVGRFRISVGFAARRSALGSAGQAHTGSWVAADDRVAVGVTGD